MYNGLLKSFLITPAAFVAVFLLFAPSWSADWEVSPYVTIIEEYNDNIDFSVDEKKRDDWVTYVKPRVEAKYSTDRLRMSLNSGLEREIYVDYDELNTTNHDHELDLSYGLSRTLSLRAGGDFRKDTTLETELKEGLLVDREDRRNFEGNLGFDYAFSERLLFSGGWTRLYTEYPDDPECYERFYVDTRIDTFDLVLRRYVLSPRSSLALKMKHKRTECDTEEPRSLIEKCDPASGFYPGPKEQYEIWASFRHDFAEDYYISGEVGYHYSKSRTYYYTGPKTESVTKTRDEDNETFVFELSFHRDWERVSAELLAYRNMYINTDGGHTYRNRVALKGTYRFSARFASSVTATFHRNRADDSDYDSDYYKLSPSLSYDLTPTVTLRASADYLRYDYDKRSDKDRERFRARLFLNFTWPRLLSGY